MVTEAAIDRQFLREDAYADSSKLRARASIYDYRFPKGSLMDWVLDVVDWPDGVQVLDVGCGPGFYLEALATRNVRRVGIDLSPGMAAEAARHAPTAVADAAVLPFPTAAFDRILAPHMLYHCPDIPVAVGELRRVLRPGGVLIAVTNSEQHLHELRAIHLAVAKKPPSPVSERFSVENGAEFLETAFDDVNLVSFDGELRVPDVGLVVNYLASMMSWHGDADAAKTMAGIEEQVATIIEREGVFRVRTAVGVFVCR
jgi:SAM-dependent methyltransferase